MFINGLFLGCLWGIIFSFMEGRRLTDILAGLLGVSMVISFATAKSLGLYLMQALYVSECWMPVLIGAFALPVLALLGGCVGDAPTYSRGYNDEIQARSTRQCAMLTVV